MPAKGHWGKFIMMETLAGTEGFFVYEGSRLRAGEVELALVRVGNAKFLYLSRSLPGFTGRELQEGGVLCPLTPENARALMELVPELKPRRLPHGPSFGFGDRIGLATPGHIRAARGSRAFPVLAQQSVRENARTGRSFAQVLADAAFGALQEGYLEGFAADADHLKSVEDAREAAKWGYTFFTCDPSDHVVAAERLSERILRRRFLSLPDAPKLKSEYLDKSFEIEGLGKLWFSETELMRAAVKYLRAVEFAAEMYHALKQELPGGFDFELSVDETETPTSPLEHYFVVQELKRRDVELTSLAPRFSGALEKAVDYRGDLEVFRRDLKAHVALAKALGGYRISLHSGSDKFSLYPLFAKEAEGLFHIKTAGTSYLVALEVVAERAPELFREIYRLSVERFAEDRVSYHLSTNTAALPSPEGLSDEELRRLLEEPDPRQVLHVAYGSVLQSPLGDELKRVLLDHESDYISLLERHLGRHLELLGVRG